MLVKGGPDVSCIVDVCKFLCKYAPNDMSLAFSLTYSFKDSSIFCFDHSYHTGPLCIDASRAYRVYALLNRVTHRNNVVTFTNHKARIRYIEEFEEVFVKN